MVSLVQAVGGVAAFWKRKRSISWLAASSPAGKVGFASNTMGPVTVSPAESTKVSETALESWDMPMAPDETSVVSTQPLHARPVAVVAVSAAAAVAARRVIRE